ncbi:dehydrogenase [Roseiconus nitratireducens]|uniref:Dehydrogenase n=1 Tax=Roseiconus nitratireducens TaxID=2605748 RepID=A0A5M6DHR1_9BACT|nr:PVC-type heme-binding CxxCH protein [Roseiconus nitratireducens]KAA5547061.1 dehydrogenase [Roseiconus nitratireducens]
MLTNAHHRLHRPWVIFWFALPFFVAREQICRSDQPQLADPRLRLTLFAEDPEIRTPIGLAVADDDRLFVIESHTHHPPEDYPGPSSDRIKVFDDRDADGHADSVTVVADGLHQAMNLAFSPEGRLFVVCARQVFELLDRDGDGIFETQSEVLRLETKERYAHNCLLAITFDRDGWMYVARGNTASKAYRLVAADGAAVAGYGDGGSVVRCRPDGSELAEFATGFWNPFDLDFDRWGRLLLLDNDPDARGPNRLVHVIRGGDYGYRSLFGGDGTHPYQGWDGRLPGTLPFLAGTGEAPCGLIDCQRTSFPSDYGNSVLATIWNENSVQRFEMNANTGEVTGRSVLISGGTDFRPVAIDSDRNGNVYLTDWVLVDYPNHGRGRIWRISTDSNVERIHPLRSFDGYQTNSAERQIAAIKAFDGARLVEWLAGTEASNPMLDHVAVMRLAEPQMEHFRKRCGSGNVRQRMAALLSGKRAHLGDVGQVRQFLTDPDPRIRQAALIWAGDTLDLSLAVELQRVIEITPVTPELFATYLATVEILQPDFVTTYRQRRADAAKSIPRTLDPDVLIHVAKDPAMDASVRAQAIERFDDPTCQREQAFLRQLLDVDADSDAQTLVIAAMKGLSRIEQTAGQSVRKALIEIAADASRSAVIRCEALALVDASGQQVADPETKSALRHLLDASPLEVAVQAARTLRHWDQTVHEGSAAADLSRLRPAVRKALQPEPKDDRPESISRWREVLAQGGDAMLGRHVFFNPRVGCSKCHRLDGRGGTLGPGLGSVSVSKSRRQIIDSILDPSAEFPPQYQAWMVLTTDGQIHRGLQLDHKAGGAIVLTLEDGQNRRFDGDEIEAYRALSDSLMPSGLSETMTVDELRDLIAFLESVGHEPASSDPDASPKRSN